MNESSGGHLIVGATSEIGRAVALELARAYGKIVLAARDDAELAAVADDLRVRTGAAVTWLHWQAPAFDQQAEFLRQAIAAFGSLDGVTMCHGFMPDQQQAAHDWSLAHEMIEVNYSTAVCLLNLFADHFEEQKRGYICGISSVAGDRGRQSNYLYGATKAAFTAYLSGLRNRLHRSGVAVITVKPGFVDTTMTWGRLNAESPLVATPELIARKVMKAIRKRKNVVYTPWFWAPIMCLIRCIPEPLFKRLRL